MSQSIDLKGALSLLENVMTQRKAAGASTVAISDNAMTQLQNLPITFMKAANPVAAAAPAPQAVVAEAKTPAPTPVQTQQKAEPIQQPAPQQAPAPTAKPEPTPAATPAAAQPSPAPAPTPAAAPAPQQPLENPYGDLAVKTEMRGRVEIIHPAGDTLRDKLNNLFRLAKRCEVCRGMGTLRDQLVFATGNPEADIMFIGEAPGSEEEQQKKPFVGPAGQKLNQILQAMGLKRDDVYISNILKYRPKMGDGRFQGAKNRKPTPDEIAASVKFVRSEIALLQPKVIVALGGTAAEGLLEMSGSVGSMRGKFFELDGIPVSVTYHPSYLLRVESEPDKELARVEKRKVWEDALAVMDKIGMPVSDKQRGFFS